MEERSEKAQAQEPGGVSGEELDGPTRKGRLRRAFGFLGAPLFWGGLVMGMVVFAAGVAIGLGAARWMDDDRWMDDHGGGGKGAFSFRVDPEEEYRKEEAKNPWGRVSDQKGFGQKNFPFREENVPDAIWERVESLIEEIEQLVAKASDYLDDEGSPSDFLDEFFGSGSWQDDLWEGDGPDGALGRSGFPFGELLPGLAFLEECEFDLQSFSEGWEGLPDAAFEGAEDSENLEGFLEQMEALFEEICQTPAEQ